MERLSKHLQKREFVFLDYVILVFFLTDIWYLGYVNILEFLKNRFPFVSSVTFVANIKASAVYPAPYDIPLYLVMTFFFVIILFLFYDYFKNKVKFIRAPIYLKFLSLTFLLIFFISRLGNYPLGEPFSIFDGTTIVFLASIIFVIATIPVFDYLSNLKSLLRYSIYILILLIIAFLTFEPKFPISFYDYSCFFGPVYEITRGKTIYTDIAPLYGFLNILILSVFSKLGFNIFYLPLLVWILYIVQYFLSFFLIYKLSRSAVFSTMAVFSIITIGYFSLFHLPISVPSIGPLRWLPMVLVLFAFHKLKRPDSKIFLTIISFLSLLTIDVGIGIISAYILFLLMLIIKRNLSFLNGLKATFYLLTSLILFFLIIQFFHLLLGLKAVDIVPYLKTLNQYSREGLGMLKLESLNYFWLVVLLYFASVIYFVRKNSIDFTDQLILFSANISFFGSIYFLHRSHPHSLFHISLIVLLNFFLLTGNLLKNIHSKKLRKIVLVALFFLFIAFPAYNRHGAASNIISQKSYYMSLPNIFTPIVNDVLDVSFSEEKKLIESFIIEDKVVILSRDDTYYFYLTKKLNLLNTNPQETSIFTTEELKTSVKEAIKICPKKIAVNCSVYNKCPDNRFQNENAVQPELLEEIEKGCQIKYKPVKCTEKLCISQRD